MNPVVNSDEQTLDIQKILQHLPHRYPFVLVDRVIEIEPGKRLVAIKNVTINEPFFNGHFPQQPIMPGVLILESMAQASALLAAVSFPQQDRVLHLFAGIDKARFKRKVQPGDQLQLEVELIKTRKDICKANAVARVEGQLVCSAELISATVDVE